MLVNIKSCNFAYMINNVSMNDRYRPYPITKKEGDDEYDEHNL